MMINRIWAMPNKWTFTIKPIAELLQKYVGSGNNWIDPILNSRSSDEDSLNTDYDFGSKKEPQPKGKDASHPSHNQY